VELPRLQSLYETYRDQGLEIVAVEARGDTERATAFIDEKGLTYTFLENGSGDADIVGPVFGVYGFPTSFLVDREGRVMFAHLGFELGDEEKIAEEIESLL
jgi:peroxiredoxin